MANSNIRSSECAWHHSEVKVFGRTVRGLRGWEWKKETEKDFLYGSGQKPIDIQEGNTKCTGSFKVLGFERDAWNKAAQAAGYDDITSVPHEAIVALISYRKLATDPITTITVRGVAFTETGGGLDQGAKNEEVTLPWLAMDIVPVTR